MCCLSQGLVLYAMMAVRCITDCSPVFGLAVMLQLLRPSVRHSYCIHHCVMCVHTSCGVCCSFGVQRDMMQSEPLVHADGTAPTVLTLCWQRPGRTSGPYRALERVPIEVGKGSTKCRITSRITSR